MIVICKTQNIIDMTRCIVWILLLLIGSSVFAQKADFKACSRYSEKNLKSRIHSSSVYPSWIGRTDFFWYYYTTDEGMKYYLVDAGKGKKQELFSIKEFAAKLAELTGKTEDVKNLRLAGFQFEGDNPYRFTFSKCGKSFEYNVKTGELKEFRKEEVKREFERKIYWQNWSPDGKYMVYAYKHNVYLPVSYTHLTLPTN